jgi:hypothetical protein
MPLNKPARTIRQRLEAWHLIARYIAEHHGVPPGPLTREEWAELAHDLAVGAIVNGEG